MTATGVLLSFLVLLGIAKGFRFSGQVTSLGTFNAALLPQYPQIDERVTLLTHRIKESKLDVICLQEMWKTNFQRQIFNDVRHIYPHAVSLINLTATADVGNTTACTLAEVQSFVFCTGTNCNASSPPTCLAEKCLHVLVPLTVECRVCLFINVDSTGAIFNCAMEPVTDYEQSFGLMLLSKKAITTDRVNGYLGNVSEVRGFIQASIPEVGEVFCTHLSTPAGAESTYVGPPVVSPFLFDSYAEQQYRELLTLLDTASATDSSILMGDFNHGPTVATPPGISSIFHEMPFNYGYVQARGYYSPYVQLDRRCTICYENPAVPLTSKIVDHIYVPLTSSERVVATTRFWDEERTEMGTPLSDHYGVKIILKDLSLCSSDFWACRFRKDSVFFPTQESPDEDLQKICMALDN